MLRVATRATAALLHRAAYALWAKCPADADWPTGQKRPPCYEIKLDNVIHYRNDGWRNGAMYGPIVPDAKGVILGLMRKGRAVVVRTQRTNLHEVAAWLEGHGIPAVACNGEPRGYWTDTTRVLVTARALTVYAEITPYAVPFQDWEQTAQYLKDHVGRTALSVSRAVLLPFRIDSPWYRYALTPSTTDASCTLTVTGWHPMTNIEYAELLDAPDQESLTTRSAEVNASVREATDTEAQRVLNALQEAGITVEGTVADLRGGGVRLTLST
ncbi:hypothetical protein ACWEV4_29710 [Streptomyces sp. NPDC003860]